jgi:hypothetical protein
MPVSLLRAPVLAARHAFDDLAERQAYVVRRDQLAAVGVTEHHVRAQLFAARWATYGPLVIILHNGPLTGLQRRWATLLNAGPGAALCARTALELDGLQGWGDDRIHVLVRRGARVPALPGVKVHESRRYEPGRDLHPAASPPRTRTERSAIDAAAWSRNSRTACGLLAAVVQQRLALPHRLTEELAAAGRVRHFTLLGRALADISGGSTALSEIDFVRLCRRHALPEPRRQRLRRDSSGRRRYLDAEFRARDGSTVVVEVDGAVHLLVQTYWDDMDRQNSLTVRGERVLRYPTVAFYLQPARTMREIGVALGY